MFGAHQPVPPCEVETVIMVEAAGMMQIVVGGGADPARQPTRKPPARHQLYPGMTHRVA